MKWNNVLNVMKEIENSIAKVVELLIMFQKELIILKKDVENVMKDV